MGSTEIALRHAEGAGDIALVRRLFANYAAYLGANPTGAANICIQDFDRELACLPGPYAPPGGILLLAFVHGAAAGCCALKPIRTAAPHSASGDSAVELKRLWVEPHARGHDLGRHLVQAAIEHAVAMSCPAVYLDTVPAAMPEASRLYASLGFEQVSRYNQNPVPHVAFFRKLLR